MEKDGVEVIGNAIGRMVMRKGAVESKASERVKNGRKDGSRRKMGMSIEGSKEVFLVGTVEYARKAFEGVSKCDLERVIAIRPEGVADRRDIVTK
jgi:hypothetical protein